jgi:hypothetical protein
MQLKSCCKKIFILAVVMIFTLQANSQLIIALLFGDKLNSDKMQFGLTGGLSISDISNYENAKTKTGLNLGLYFNIKLNDKWYIHPEAIPKFPGGVSQLTPYSLGDANLDSLLKNGSVTRKIKNIVLPVLIRYRIKNELFMEAGPQLGLRTKAKDIFEHDNLTYENKIEDNITRFDFGFAVGLAQTLGKQPGGMSLGLRYYFGLTDIDKITAGSQKNGVLQITASIAVGAKKKNKTKE